MELSPVLSAGCKRDGGSGLGCGSITRVTRTWEWLKWLSTHIKKRQWPSCLGVKRLCLRKAPRFPFSAAVLGKGITFHQSRRPNLCHRGLGLTSGNSFICTGNPWRASIATPEPFASFPGDSSVQRSLCSACSGPAASGL